MNNVLLKKITASDFRTGATLYKWVRFCCIYCIRGSGTFRIKDEEFVFKRGDICQQPPFSEMELVSVTDDLEGVVLITEYEYILSVVNMLPAKYKQSSPLSAPTVVTLSANERHVLDQTLECIRSTYDEDGDELRNFIHQFYIRAYCLKIISLFVERTKNDAPSQSRVYEILSHFTRDLLLHYKSHRDMSFYAGLQGLSPRYFSSIISSQSGYKPTFWIDKILLSDIKFKLKTSSCAIKEVSYSLGFPSQASFCRYFKKKTGYTPQEYRASKLEQ